MPVRTLRRAREALTQVDRVDSEIGSKSGSEIGSAPGSEIGSAPVNMRNCAIVAQVGTDGRTSRACEFGVGMMATSTGDVNRGAQQLPRGPDGPAAIIVYA